MNGNLDSNNLASNAVTTAKITDASVTPAKILAGTGSTWVLASFTPTWAGASTNPAIGNGTMASSYIQVGKLVIWQLQMTFGSTTTYGTGSWSWTLPVTAKAAKFFVGSAWGLDTGTSYYTGVATNGIPSSPVTTKVSVQGNAGGNDWSNIIPFTWGNGDSLGFTYMYEAA
jgi:hypothetical protein